MMSLNFLLNFSSIVSELARLTKLRFVGDKKAILNNDLNMILDYQNRGDIALRDYQLAKIQFLVQDLQTIERYSPDLLSYFRRQLRKNPYKNEYIGIRFEIKVAASLIKKEIDFEKTESPDFSVKRPDQIFIECGSCNVSSPKQIKIETKVKSTIIQKNKKKYSNKNTVLFIDITNINYNCVNSGSIIDFEKVKESISREILNTNFGSIILFTYIANRDINRLEHSYIRTDNRIIDEKLADFLNKFYSIENHNINNWLFPSTG